MKIQSKKVLFFITVFFIFFSNVNLFSYSPEVIRYFSSLKSKEPLELIESIEKQIGQEEKLNTHPEKTKELYYLLAEVQEKMGDYEEASKTMKKLLPKRLFSCAKQPSCTVIVFAAILFYLGLHKDI